MGIAHTSIPIKPHIGYTIIVLKRKRMNIVSLRLTNGRKWNCPRSNEDLSNFENKDPSLLQMSSRTLQRPEPKILGKRGEIRLAHHLYLVWNHMHIQHINHAKKGHFIEACSFTLKIIIKIQEPIKVNRTSSLSQDHVHHNNNTTKSSQVNMHLNIIKHIIKTTLSSSHNINKHV